MRTSIPYYRRQYASWLQSSKLSQVVRDIQLDKLNKGLLDRQLLGKLK